METYERIKHLRKKLGISPERISSELGIARSTYYRYESADIDKLPVSIIEPLAKLLYTTPTYLMGWTDNEYALPDINKKEELTNNIIPIYDPISCGSGGFAEDTIIDYVVIPLHMLKKNKEYFAQKSIWR